MKRSTALAAVVLAALGAYIFWFERGPLPDSDGDPLFAIEAEAIEWIEIRRRDEDPVRLARDGDSWRLVEPVESAADATEVDLLLQNLATMKYERAVAKASEANLADFGLVSPSIEVRFRLAGGEERRVDFGADAPTTSNQYARRDEGEDIVVLRSHLSLNFERTAWDLRDKSIFDDGDSSEPKRIAIDRPSGPLVLEKENGLWLLTGPRRARADRYQATSLASRFRNAEMSDVLSESGEGPAECGLAAPARRLSIELEDEAAPPLVLEVGAEREGRFCGRTSSRKPTFLLDASLVADLDKAVEEFLSKKLFDFSTFEVSRLRIETGDGIERSVERKTSEDERRWLEGEHELAAEAVEDFLYALHGATAADVVPAPSLEKLGLVDPDLTLTVWSREPPVEEKVRVSKAGDGDLVYAIREGDEVALEISISEWSKIDELLPLEPKPEEGREETKG